ncbi:MAG: hypothetical protein QM820_46350 [Minicystis sp.]
MSSRSDPGATVAARGQSRPSAPTPTRDSAPVPLDRVRNTLPGPLKRFPLPAVLAWSGLGAIAITVSLAITVRSAGAVEMLEEDETAVAEPGPTAAAPTPAASSGAPAAPAKPAAPRAPATEIQAAATAGGDALAQLAQRFPEDPAVVKALFLAQAGDKKTYSAALRTARRLLEVAPDMGGNTEFRAALVNIANGPSDTSAVALDVMVSEMGAHGADLLLEVASGGVLLSKTKAATLLKDPEVRRNASRAVLLAADLLETRPCARKTLFERAKTEGDARALPYLKPLLNTVCGGGGGGFRGIFGGAPKGGGECYRCFTAADREQIQAAISAIEARDGNLAPAPSGNPPK